MLNKEICLQCHRAHDLKWNYYPKKECPRGMNEEYLSENIEFCKRCLNERIIKYCPISEYHWSKGHIYCFAVKTTIDIDKDVPESCIYILEQIISK